MRTRGVNATTSQRTRGGGEAPLQCRDGVWGRRPAVASSRPPLPLHDIFVLVVVSRGTLTTTTITMTMVTTMTGDATNVFDGLYGYERPLDEYNYNDLCSGEESGGRGGC